MTTSARRLALSSILLLVFSAATLFAAAQTPAAQKPCPTAPVMDHGQPVNGAPLASPPAEAVANLSGKSITIHYNAPSMRCRTIMGDLVPYDKVWRTGANPATSFVTQGDITIGGFMVPAGSYTLYTLPAAPGSPWQLIINKQTGQWGTEYKPEMDLGRIPMRGAMLSTPQEVMSITFEHTLKTSTQLHIKWEKTDVYVPIKAEY
jgi:hypothetical protein